MSKSWPIPATRRPGILESRAWKRDVPNWYVGTPGMSALVRPLAESVRVHTNRRVHTLQWIDKGWHLWFDDQTSSGPFAAVAVAVPAPEASLILGREAPELADQIGGVRFSPCWALMIRLE